MIKEQLFLLHFAGGNFMSYRFLEPMLSKFDVIPLELPGRGRRVNEDLLYDFELAAQDLCNQIVCKLSSDKFIIYGHSLGAYLGLRVCGMLEEKKYFPTALVVSGSPGPGVIEYKSRYELKDEDFLKVIKDLGGVTDDFFKSKELLDFFLPIIRADFFLAENSFITQIVNTPIHAIMGNEEEDCDKLHNWINYTTSKVKLEILVGNHFFIFQHYRRIAEIISNFSNKN